MCLGQPSKSQCFDRTRLAPRKLAEMVAFVIAKSGGRDGRFVKYLQAFHRNAVTASSRQGVPAALYEALANFKHVHLAVALLETAMTCPARYLTNKGCGFVLGTEVSKLGKEDSGSRMGKKVSGC